MELMSLDDCIDIYMELLSIFLFCKLRSRPCTEKSHQRIFSLWLLPISQYLHRHCYIQLYHKSVTGCAHRRSNGCRIRYVLILHLRSVHLGIRRVGGTRAPLTTAWPGLWDSNVPASYLAPIPHRPYNVGVRGKSQMVHKLSWTSRAPTDRHLLILASQ